MDLDNIIEHKVVRQSSNDLDIPIDIQPRPLDKRVSHPISSQIPRSLADHVLSNTYISRQ
jgi:hypothetical protein